MRGIAVATSLLVAVVLGTTAPGISGGSPKARASALRLLETLTVPSAAKGGTVVRTKTALRKGRTYRLVASESITQSKTDATGRTVTYTLDPLYCWETTDPAFGGNCSFAVPVYSPRLELTLPPSSSPVTSFDFAAPGSTRLPFSREHRYRAEFKAPASGPVYARTEPVPSVQEDSYSGVYKLQVWGEAPRKKKRKKKRKKRRVGCRAPRAASTSARAAAGCRWFASYNIDQAGVPFDSSRPVLSTETVGVGAIFFSSEPKPGRTVRGSAAGVIYHTDFLDPTADPSKQETTLEPLSSDQNEYRFGGQRRILRLRLYTVEPYDPNRRVPHDILDDRVELVLVDDRSLGRDLMQLDMNFLKDDQHRYRVSSQNELRITISKPRPR